MCDIRELIDNAITDATSPDAMRWTPRPDDAEVVGVLHEFGVTMHQFAEAIQALCRAGTTRPMDVQTLVYGEGSDHDGRDD